MLLLKNALIFDGTNDEMISDHSVLIEGNVIKAIRPHNDFNGDVSSEVLDLDGYIILPGLIDSHLHFFLEEIPSGNNKPQNSMPDGNPMPNIETFNAIKGIINAQKTIEAGFTTAYDGGGINFADAALKESINKNLINGPRYYICGKQITASEGHFNGISRVAVGPWGMREAVREMMWWGVDHIKIKMSAPVRIPGRDPGRSEFTIKEVEAAVDEAHRGGLKVGVHARGANSIKDALKAGVDIIVHGTGIDDECIDLMLSNGNYLLPTLYAPPREPDELIKNAKSKNVVKQLEGLGKLHWSSLKKAYNRGVKMALATDSGGLSVKHGHNYEELLRLNELGMPPIQALKAATSEAAKVLSLESYLGQIREGYLADIIAIKGPALNLNSFNDVRLVIKDGTIVKNLI